jgi:FtsH-binding integral membrane protein
MLAVITGCQSYLVSMICAEYSAESVFYVFLITSVTFFATTVYAFTTKINIEIHKSMFVGIAACSLLVSVLLIFTRIPGMLIFYSFLGTVITLLFIVIDTEMIINSHKYGITYDDYIVAALVLYLDFINLFLELLRLFGQPKK